MIYLDPYVSDRRDEIMTPEKAQAIADRLGLRVLYCTPDTLRFRDGYAECKPRRREK